MSEKMRRVLIISSVGHKMNLTSVTAPATHTLKDRLRLPVWVSSLSGDSGELPSSFSTPPVEFQPTYYSFDELKPLDPETPFGQIPSPSIVFALHQSELPVELVRSVLEEQDGVKEFIQKDKFIPDTMQHDIFLCYATADRERAGVLAEAISNAGLRCFMAEKSLEAGDLWSDEIRRALVSSKEMCLLCSPNSIKSEWVLTEWGAAWALSKRVVPILHRIDVANLPERLRSHQVVDFADYQVYVSEAARRLK